MPGTSRRIVTVEWSDDVVPFKEVRTAEHELLDGRGLYMLLSGTPDPVTAADRRRGIRRWTVNEDPLRYLGVAFAQTLRVRIPQDHGDVYDRLAETLVMNPAKDDALVVLGELVEATMGGRDVTDSEATYKATECAFIHRMVPVQQSMENSHCSRTYARRHGPIRARNKGEHDPLPKTVTLDGGETRDRKVLARKLASAEARLTFGDIDVGFEGGDAVVGFSYDGDRLGARVPAAHTLLQGNPSGGVHFDADADARLRRRGARIEAVRDRLLERVVRALLSRR